MGKKAQAPDIPTYLLYGEAPGAITGSMLHEESIEARSARHHWKIDPHRHTVLHQMILVLRGQGVVLADGARAQYRPPALILVPAGSVHGFEFEPGTDGHILSVSDSLLRDIARNEPGVDSLFAQPLTMEFQRGQLRATGLQQAFRRLARELSRRDPGRMLALQGWLQVLLANALRLAQQGRKAMDTLDSQRRLLMIRFGELLESRFRRAPTVPECASALGVSESRLRTTCLAQTGQSPIQLIHARVLLEAKRQLLYTEHAVSEIGYGLGFEDPAYFTRFFSRGAGVSPRAFRSRGPDYLTPSTG